MRKVIVTLVNAISGETKTVTVANRSGQALYEIHKKIVKEYPGYYVKKFKPF